MTNASRALPSRFGTRTKVAVLLVVALVMAVVGAVKYGGPAKADDPPPADPTIVVTSQCFADLPNEDSDGFTYLYGITYTNQVIGQTFYVYDDPNGAPDGSMAFATTDGTMPSWYSDSATIGVSVEDGSVITFTAAACLGTTDPPVDPTPTDPPVVVDTEGGASVASVPAHPGG